MVILTKRNKKKTNSQAHGPMSGGAMLGIGDMARLTGIAAHNRNKGRSLVEERFEEEREKARLTEERESASAAIHEANKGCFISRGKKICNAGSRKGKIFVSPKQFGKNIETFINEDLPKATLGVALLAGAGVEVPLVIAVAAAATKGVGFANSGFGDGSSAHKHGTVVRKKRRL